MRECILSEEYEQLNMLNWWSFAVDVDEKRDYEMRGGVGVTDLNRKFNERKLTQM